VAGDGKPSLKERLLWQAVVAPGTRIEEDRASMARTFTYLFGLGGLLLLVTLLLPAAHDRSEVGIIAMAAIAIFTAVMFTIGFDSLPLGAFKLAPALGSTVIAGVLFYGGAHALGAYAAYFFWVTLSASYFFNYPVAVANVAFALAVYAAMLEIKTGLPLPGLYWTMAAGTLFVAAPLMIALRSHAHRAADEADRVKGEFFALISHELRTPLTAMIGYLDVLFEDGDPPGNEQQRQALDVVNRNSRRLMRLVGDLLFVARVDAGNVELEYERFDLATVVRESVETFRARARREDLELSGDIAEGGSVAVRLREAGEGRAEISVADDGMGIPKAEQDELFNYFFRTSDARREQIEGTGLGLGIVKTIVENHGGTVTIDSDEGQGATVTISLPLNGHAPHA